MRVNTFLDSEEFFFRHFGLCEKFQNFCKIEIFSEIPDNFLKGRHFVRRGK